MTLSPTLLSSLLAQTRKSQQDRDQIRSKYLQTLLDRCLDGAKDTESVEMVTLSTQIIVNLLYENEQFASELLQNEEFIQWSLSILKVANIPESHESLVRNIIVLWKNLSCLIMEQLQANATQYYNNTSFIHALGSLYATHEALRPFILALIDAIVESDGIPSEWKGDSQWIRTISSVSATKDAPEEMLRLVGVMALERVFIDELRGIWYDVLVDLMRTSILEVNWSLLSEDAEELEEAQEQATLLLTTVELLVKEEEPDSSTSSTLDASFFSTLVEIIALNDASLHFAEIRIKALEILCTFMQQNTTWNTKLVRDYAIIVKLSTLFFQVAPQWSAEFLLRARRQVIRIVGFLTLEDSLLEELLSDVQNQSIVSMIETTLREERDVLLKRNACIALGNLARSDQNCNRLINDYTIAHLMCEETAHHLDLTVRIFDTGEAEKVPDVQYLSNCAFVLANLSKCPDQQCRTAFLKEPVFDLVRRMLHPKIAFLIQFYAVETLQHLLPSLRENQAFIEENVDILREIAQQLILLLQSDKSKERVKLRFVIVRCLTQMMSLDGALQDGLEWRGALAEGIEFLRQYQPKSNENLGATFSAQVDALSRHIENLIR